MAYATSQSLSRTVSTVSQVSKLQNQFLHSNVGDGTLPEANNSGTRLTGVGGAYFFLKKNVLFFLLQLVSFTVDGESTVTDGRCRQIHLTRHISRAVHTS